MRECWRWQLVVGTGKLIEIVGVMLVDFIAALTSIITGYHQRIAKLEEEKYDHEMEVARRALEVWSGLGEAICITLCVWVVDANNVTSKW